MMSQLDCEQHRITTIQPFFLLDFLPGFVSFLTKPGCFPVS